MCRKSIQTRICWSAATAAPAWCRPLLLLCRNTLLPAEKHICSLSGRSPGSGSSAFAAFSPPQEQWRIGRSVAFTVELAATDYHRFPVFSPPEFRAGLPDMIVSSCCPHYRDALEESPSKNKENDRTVPICVFYIHFGAYSPWRKLGLMQKGVSFRGSAHYSR